ncbi:MAG: hypothetical protein BZY65_02175 [SAR202 cluster bacterium Ae2-Chloro-G2]|nr:MAG: hypothetical protein BZY65_02175 [SAR202 cluster bacterium Ae2-Chloro-G2]
MPIKLSIPLIRKAVKSSSGRFVGEANLKLAGVMVLLTHRDGEYWIILNRRSMTVKHHKGEISFPGGSKDVTDSDLLFTALRETQEEMGINPEEVEVLGKIDVTPTQTGFLICPFVGIIDHPYKFSLSKSEVESILEIPLSGLFSTNYRCDEIKSSKDQLQKVPVYSFDGNVVYGATARILNNLAELIKAA